MKDLLIVLSSVMISSYVPFEMCALLVAYRRREAANKRMGCGPSDGILRAFGGRWLIRGAALIAAIRKTLVGVTMLSFIIGVVLGTFGGVGFAILFWFCELLVMGLILDALSKRRESIDRTPIRH